MKVPSKPYRSNFYLWNGVSAMFFSSCVTVPHSHNTMQIIVDIQDAFKCKVNGGEWKIYRCLILRENAIHQLDTNDSVQLLIYLDADTAVAGILKEKLLLESDLYAPESSLRSFIQPEDLQRAILEPNPELLLKVINNILGMLAGPQDPYRTDDRIAKAEEIIAITPPGQLTIKYLSEQVFLSESRLRALFKEKVGVPVYKYIMWRKIRYAINQIMAGSSVLEAAIQAGFTDASHFHKMLVNMFGISPSQFIRNSQNLNILTCDKSPLKFETSVYDQDRQVIQVYK
ncbi:MAG TPA: AraC family transcriptional regulator [Puia sp.]|nr:AraC family transcriptional regulator [Puia sp.]